jgi:excinuclease ABC subunit A
VKLDAKEKHSIDVVVDRLVIDDKIRVRLSDSVETALKWGEGTLVTLHQLPEGDDRAGSPLPAVATAYPGSGAVRTPRPTEGTANNTWLESLHSNRSFSPVTGKSYERVSPKHFSFNSPHGACPVCHGLGQKMVFDARCSRSGEVA